MEKIEQILEENVRLKEVIKKLREKLSKLEDICRSTKHYDIINKIDNQILVTENNIDFENGTINDFIDWNCQALNDKFTCIIDISQEEIFNYRKTLFIHLNLLKYKYNGIYPR